MTRYYPPQDPIAVGLAGKCPRCGQGQLFKGFLKLEERCDACHLDYAKADTGDGPAVFMIFIAGFISTVVLFVTAFGLQLPAWVALALALLSLVIVIGLFMQPLKGVMVALQYANRAAETGSAANEDKDWS